MAVVALDSDPGGEIGILPYRGAAPGTPIAVRRSNLPYGSPHVQPPAIGELSMDVGIERPLGRKPRGAPVVPVVEVPPELLKNFIRLIPDQIRPVGPGLPVSLQQEADVIDLEPRRAPLIRGLEVQPLARHFGEADFPIGPAE